MTASCPTTGVDADVCFGTCCIPLTAAERAVWRYPCYCEGDPRCDDPDACDRTLDGAS